MPEHGAGDNRDRGSAPAQVPAADVERNGEASVESHFAVVDGAGAVVMASRGAALGPHPGPLQPGDNLYERLREQPSAAPGSSLADGLRAVLEGERDEWAVEVQPAPGLSVRVEIQAGRMPEPARGALIAWRGVVPCEAASGDGEAASDDGEAAFGDGKGAFGDGEVASGDGKGGARREHDLAFEASLLKYVNNAVIATDLDGVITHWNDAAEAIYQWSREEVLGRRVLDVVVPEDGLDQAREILERLPEGSPWRGEINLRRKNGELFPAFVSDSAVRGANNEIVGFVGISVDITDRKRARMAVQQSQERLLLALNAAGMVAWEWRPATDSMLRFGDLEDVLGDPASTSTGEDLFSRIHPEDRDAVRRSLESSLDLCVPYHGEFRYRKPDGTYRWFSDHGRVKTDESGARVMTGAMMDITARMDAHERLRLSEEQYRFLADALPQFVWTANARGAIEFCNRHWFEYTGLSFDQTVQAWDSILHPDDRERIVELVRASSERKVPYQAEYRIRRASDGAYRWHLSRAGTFEDIHGELRRVGTAVDIQDRKLAEEELTRQAQELGRSNADLQQFAYVTSHDLQEPLRIIHSYAQLLQQRYAGRLDADADEFIAFITAAVRRMEALIQDLLSYSRVVNVDSLPMAAVQMDGTVHWAMMNLHAAIQESGARIRFADLPAVMGSQVQLVQLFQNLLSNAIKYRGEALPEVHVEAEREGGRWLFSVRDNGIGIDPQYQERIFGIFKRLHGRDIPGTGIGLAICEKIVYKHGGRIWVESRSGEGATFRFTLPALPS